MTGRAGGEPEASLGVLFVHGMGTRTEGATLREMGEPLIEWLKLGHLGIENLELGQTQLASGAGGEPAHARCTLTGADGSTRTWILAESWWSESFMPPSYARMAFWLIAAVPWMLVDYMRGALKRENQRTRWTKLRGPRRVLIGVYAFVGAVLAGPLVLLLTALLLVRLIPIASVRKAGDALARVLSATLGDVYVILATHVDRAAIRHRIVRNHIWLQQRCRNTVIVAHSAGSALTHQLLRDGRITGVHTYITFGEAIWRMKWMADLSQRGAIRMWAVALAVAGSACIVGAWLAFALANGCWRWICVPVGLVGIALDMVSARIVWKDSPTDDIRTKAIELLAGKILRWRDYVASSDPVPAGALTEAAHSSVPDLRRPESTARTAWSRYQPIGIRNRRSIVFDHTSYPGNVEGFVAGVALDLARADTYGASLELAITPKQLEEARKARALRTLSLALMRPASLVVGSILAAAVATSAGSFGNVGAHFGWVIDAVHALPGKALDDHVTDHRVGMAVVLVLCVAPWLAAGRAWKVWSGLERARFFAIEKGATRLPGAHLAVAAAWWAGTATASVATLLLADVDSTGWWVAIVVALTGGVVLVSSVKTVMQKRDLMYSTAGPENSSPAPAARAEPAPEAPPPEAT